MRDTAAMIDPLDFQRYRRLSTRAEARAAFDQIAARAQRSLRIADDRGEFYGFERKAFADALDALLARSRHATVQIVVHEASFIEKSCAHLIALLRRRSPRLAILRSDESVRGYPRGFVLADDIVVLRRAHFDCARSYLDFDENAVSQARELIDELVADALPAVNVTTTGL